MLNRQARLSHEKEWTDYGPKTHCSAAKSHSQKQSTDGGLRIMTVLTRCSDHKDAVMEHFVTVSTAVDVVPMRHDWKESQ